MNPDSQETGVVAAEIVELAVAESVSTTTITTLSSQPMQQQWGPSTSAYYPGYSYNYPQQQQQQHPFQQQGGNFWTQNYGQWPQQQQQQQDQYYQGGEYQEWPRQQQCQELANFNVDLFRDTNDDDDDDIDVGQEGPVSRLAPDLIREEILCRQEELSQSEAVLKDLQGAAEKLQEEEVRRRCPTLPEDLAGFLTSVACLESTRRVGLEAKVVQLREELQKNLISLAKTETAAYQGGDDAKRLNEEFKALAQKVCSQDLADIFSHLTWAFFSCSTCPATWGTTA
jgi:hypothetical protein